MRRRLLLQLTGPTVLIGAILFGTCLLSTWYVDRLQTDLTNIREQNVSSMLAAQNMETHVRALRFHSFLFLIEPDASLLDEIARDEESFEEWLDKAEELAYTEEEQTALQTVRRGYANYQGELQNLREDVEKNGPRKDLRVLAVQHPVRHVTDACREYSRLNEEMIARTSQESRRVTRRLHFAMLLLGLGGPVSGLLSGFGIARGLTRSLYRLSVRVQDMAHHLEQDVAMVRLTPDADIEQLDKQLERVVARVGEVAAKLQRQQQEILRTHQLAAVGQLAASVAHEVRNPLTSMKILVEAGLQTRKPKPFTQENMKVVLNEILRLEKTVQSFLDFARPPVLQRRVCDLREVVAQALEIVRARIRQHKVQPTQVSPDYRLSGYIDQSQLCTVFVNLFINALDAMPSGGNLRVCLREAFPWNIQATVEDTGNGIDPEIVEKLFEPFVSTRPTGSGLGLSICKRVIEDHGGTIAAGNRPEGGACFSITLPRADESHKERTDPDRENPKLAGGAMKATF